MVVSIKGYAQGLIEMPPRRQQKGCRLQFRTDRRKFHLHLYLRAVRQNGHKKRLDKCFKP